MSDKSPMGNMALNKALSKWATHNTMPREMSAFVDGFAAASAPLLALIEEMEGMLSYAQKRRYQEHAELETQVATARDDALEAAAAICELDLTEAYWYPDAYYPQAIRALKSQHADKGATP